MEGLFFSGILTSGSQWKGIYLRLGNIWNTNVAGKLDSALSFNKHQTTKIKVETQMDNRCHSEPKEFECRENERVWCHLALNPMPCCPFRLDLIFHIDWTNKVFLNQKQTDKIEVNLSYSNLGLPIGLWAKIKEKKWSEGAFQQNKSIT